MEQSADILDIMPNLFDSANAPITEPTALVVGDFVQWKRTDLSTDYPNNLYTLSYEARREGTPARLVSITAAASGDDYLVTLASSVTAEYETGDYHWAAYITRDSDSARVQVDLGRWTVKSNRAEDGNDPAGFARRMLNQIEAAIEHRADNKQLDVLAYSLGAETSATRDPAKLLEWRTFFRQEIRRINQRANAKKGRRPSNFVQVSFK